MVASPGNAPGPGAHLARFRFQGGRFTLNYTAKIGRLDGTRTRIARLRGGSPVLVRGQGVKIGRRDRIRTCTGFRPRVSETRASTVPPLAEKIWCGRSDLHAHAPRARRFLRPPGLLFHTRPQNGRGGRSRTGTGNHAQRGLSPPCLRSNHAAINWCGQRDSHPHGLSPIGSSGRGVYCSTTSA